MSNEENPESPQDKERIHWHPAFVEAIQMELDEYSEDLQFMYEYQLRNC
jgi:hypothetical protein